MISSPISAKNLCVLRGDNQVLDNVSFTIDAGDIFALLGGNGAGKSTTLLTFLGLISPSSGQALINGVEVGADIQGARAQISYLPESANLYPHLSAYENLEYFLSLAHISRSPEEISLSLDEVKLAPEARKKPLSSYSKGMRQKVAISLAILRRSPLLLLDEPTSGLDPLAIDEFNIILKTLSNLGTTIFMVTHDVYGACEVAKRVGLLRQGKMTSMFQAREDQKISVDEVHQAFRQSQVS